MIDLREVVVAPGAAPLTATIRAGEVVRVEGPHASAFCDVLAGRRAPLAGEVIRRRAQSAIRLHASDRLPGDPGDALRLFAALAGASAPDARVADAASAPGDEARAIARARVAAPPLWIVDGALGPAAEDLVQAAADEIRAGGAAIVWTASPDPRRARVDRTIVVEPGGAATSAPPLAPAARRARVAGAAALGRFVAATASSRAALGLAAVAAACLALAGWTVAAHEGFWYDPGTAAATGTVGPLAIALIALVAGAATAVRASSSPTWPAMLRDTGARARVRLAAVLAGDAAIALPALAVGAIASVGLAPVILGAAAAASATARLLRGSALGAVAGSLTGGAATAILLW